VTFRGKEVDEEDKWKGEFLQEVKKSYYINLSTIYECDKFRLMGLPFFNNKDEYYLKFKESFENIL